MKILLVNSYFLEYDANEAKIMKPYPPLGLLYLSAYLKAKGFDVEIFDGTFEKMAHYIPFLSENPPDIVGIYSNVITRELALQLVIKTKEQGIPVIVGGPDATVDGEDYLNAGAFACVLGEGEITVSELLTLIREKGFDADYSKIDGLLLQLDGDVFSTKARERIKDLDDLPFPDRESIDINRYMTAWRDRHDYSSLNLITSRGCPYQCTWCSKAIFGDVFLQRSTDSVIAELQMLKDQYSPDQLWFADDLLTLRRQWTLELCDKIIEKQLQVPFECLARVDRIDAELLSKMHLAGCYRIWFGGESGAQHMIDKMKKNFTLEQIQQAISMTQDAGIEAGLFILIGYPGETMKDFFKTLAMIKNMQPDKCGNSVAYPIKGTHFYDEVKDRLSEDYSWSKRNENRIAFRGLYPESFYFFAIRLVNNWAFYWKGKRERDHFLRQVLRLTKIAITWTAVLSIGTYYDIKKKVTGKSP